jgi:NADPH:quinone reductase
MFSIAAAEFWGFRHGLLDKVNRLIEAGPFEVKVARTFTLDQAADAQRALNDHYLGKLALITK